MFEALLNARLLTVAANVYPNVAPEGYKTPCCVYQRIGTETLPDLDGGSESSFVTFQLSISSPKFLEAMKLARAIKKNLIEWDEEDACTMSWVNETAAVDNSTPTTLHRVMLFFRFWSAE